MRFRSMLATLTACLLLAITCAASACETTCLVNSVSGKCHHAGAAASAIASASGMVDCGMAAPATASETATHLATAADLCRIRLCCEQPQTILRAESRPILQQASAPRAFLFTDVVSAPDLPVAVRAQSPPLRASLLISLQSILRV